MKTRARATVFRLGMVLSACSPPPAKLPSSTPTTRAQSYLEKATSEFEAAHYTEAAAAAAIALEDAKEKSNSADLLQARVIQACSQYELGDTSLRPFQELLKEKDLTQSQRKLLGQRVSGITASARSTLDQGRKDLERKAYPAALDKLEQGLSRLHAFGDHSQDGPVHSMIGRCHLALGDKSRAQDSFRLSLKARPKDPVTGQLLARLEAKERKAQAVQKAAPRPAQEFIFVNKGYENINVSFCSERGKKRLYQGPFQIAANVGYRFKMLYPGENWVAISGSRGPLTLRGRTMSLGFSYPDMPKRWLEHFERGGGPMHFSFMEVKPGEEFMVRF